LLAVSRVPLLYISDTQRERGREGEREEERERERGRERERETASGSQSSLKGFRMADLLRDWLAG
jgi:hypothetical protein